MSMIQIRGVPEQLHRKLKARAALAWQSLSDYLLAEIRRSLERPTREDLLARVASRARVDLKESAADALRAERAGR
jgi:plasmid stability protein